MTEHDDIKAAKTALANLKATPPLRGSPLMDLMRAIVHDVLESMRQGHKIDEIVAKLNETRAPDQQINTQTFRNYLQQVREEQGLPPVQPKRKKPAPKKPSQPRAAKTPPKPPSPQQSKETEPQKDAPTSHIRTMRRPL